MAEAESLIAITERKAAQIAEQERRRARNYVYLVLPLLIYLGALFVYPIGTILWRSFWDLPAGEGFFANYIHLIDVPVYLQVLVNTVRIAIVVTLGCLALGYPIAYILANTSPKVSAVLYIFVIIPFWISLLVRTYSWMVLLGRNGIINKTLMGFGLVARDKPLELIYNLMGVNVGMIHILMPFMILSIFAVMKGIDKNLPKAGNSLGASRFQSFIRIYFPLSLPGVAGGSLLVFIMALGFYVTPALLGGPKETMVSMLIANLVQQLSIWGLASALAFVLLVSTLIMLLIYNRFLGLDKLWGGAT